MMYYEFKVGEAEKEQILKLRLNSRSLVALEDKLGENPIMVLSSMDANSLPKLEVIISILHASLQAYEHSFTEAKTYDLYDKYVDEGGNMIEFIQDVILEVFKVSGFFPKAAILEMEAKQAAAQKELKKKAKAAK